MDRYWLLTWTTYGTWLPGDARGFVSDVREGGDKVLHNEPGTPYEEGKPGLRRYVAARLIEPPVWLDEAQARRVADQLRETATHRGWQILALAVMSNHAHVLVGVPGDPDPDDVRDDFKAYATRCLNEGWGRRKHWWTRGGSCRKKATAEAIRASAVYVRDQHRALAVWLPEAVIARLAVTGPEAEASGRA